MGKKLIICEKHSMADSFAKFLNCPAKDKLNYENDEYVITKLSGHIIALKEMKDYDEIKKFVDPQKEKLIWTNIELPFFPEPFKFVPMSNAKEMYTNVINQINREDIDIIYNSGDPDNEGQVIGEMPIRLSKTNKKIKRIFAKSITKEDLFKELEKDQDNSLPQFQGMFNAGMARSKIDWLYGMNLTVYATVKSGSLMKVGRLKVPIIEYIYNREMEIENFVPEKYFTLESNKEFNGEKISLVSKETFDKDNEEKAKEKAKELNQHKAKVLSKTTKRKVENPPALFNAIGLQKFASKKMKTTPKVIEEKMQELYVSGYISYPRSESQHIAVAEKETVKNIIDAINKKDNKLIFKDNEIFNDDKIIAGHNAIIITTNIPKEGNLSDEAKELYEIIYNRFCATFCKEECLVDETTLKIQVGEEVFNKKGTVLIQKGFTVFEDISFNNNLPNLEEGQEFSVEFKVCDKMTTPPKKIDYTELTNYLANPFKKDKETKFSENEYMTNEELENAKKGIKLGTSATTTPIITECIQSGYFTQDKKNVYSITNLGKAYMKTLNSLNIDLKPKRSVEINVMLNKIENGELDEKTVIENLKKEMTELIENNRKKGVEVEKFQTASKDAKLIGKYNDKEVYKKKSKAGKTFYTTLNNDFLLFEESNVYGKNVTLPEKDIKQLISGKSVEMTLYSKEKNKEYNALVGLDGVNDKNFAKFKITGFPKKEVKTKDENK